jgi:hypothetical protein
MKKCNINPIIKYIRIVLSLVVIGLGIYYKTWLGAVGLITLYTAFTGKCMTSFAPKKSTDYKLYDNEKQED